MHENTSKNLLKSSLNFLVWGSLGASVSVNSDHVFPTTSVLHLRLYKYHLLMPPLVFLILKYKACSSTGIAPKTLNCTDFNCWLICTALYWYHDKALHCTVLQCTAWFALHYMVLHCTARYCIASFYIKLHLTAEDSRSAHCIAVTSFPHNAASLEMFFLSPIWPPNVT